jgi:hypothetical protein
MIAIYLENSNKKACKGRIYWTYVEVIVDNYSQLSDIVLTFLRGSSNERANYDE